MAFVAVRGVACRPRTYQSVVIDSLALLLQPRIRR